MKAVENVEEILQNIFGVVNAGKQYKKYVRCVVERRCLNHIFRAYLN
ncbi:MAG TPA: hypothetical protein VG896_04355 [Candidatus Nitrosotalea sp.]|nr:hypothetical protein [Candidatus Nitrosotalea sp.]